MFMNLFSVFDPVTLIFSLNWMSMMLFFLILPQLYWFNYSRLIYLIKFINFMLMNEFKLILFNYFNMKNLFFLMVLFFYIVLNNFMGLFPYIFTASSHMLFSLMYSFSLWLSFNLFGFLKNLYFMLVHMVPMGTPFVLMMFMVLIELLSNMIRPITLSIRLMANMVAGHLLMTLLSNFLSTLIIMYLFVFFIQILLLMLEMMVSLIQSYVFIILLILYMKETN
nr:ATP synthase F0 subunit 6 [Chelonus munakatae]